MDHEAAFLQEMVGHPWTALLFADWLEDRGDPRGELLRLTNILTQSTDHPNRAVLEERLWALVASGVRPVGPFRTNVLGMMYAWIPPGTFLMSSPANEPERSDDKTQHKVTLTKGFHLGVHQVTQAQWQAVMGGNPSYMKGESNLPVENVSWDDCVAFCEALGKKDGKTYRLPTEAEWEYACRAGTTTPFHCGATISPDQANYNGDYVYGNGKKGVYRQKTTPVGSFPANAWGLFDMHGNVWEWCADWFGPYPEGELTDPQGFIGGETRVLRGGSWSLNPGSCRSAYRSRGAPALRSSYCGCRVALCLD
jgi:formylglycine-generating enzyme